MNENGTIKFIYTWPMIILAIFLFWPVGIFLMIKRISINKNARNIAAAEEMTPKVVTCPSCGANNTIVGTNGACEYCGSPLRD